MKIACYVRPFYPMIGGLEAIAESVSAHLTAAGHEVTLLTEAPLDGMPELRGRRKIIRRPGMIRLLREFRSADVTLFFGMSLRALPAAILCLKPLVLSHHGVYVSSATRMSGFLRSLRLLPTRCLVNICVSEFVAKMIPGRTVVIHNSYDDKIFSDREGALRDYDFGFCGRLVSEKGANILLDAFADICQSNSLLRIALVGDGPERSVLEALVLAKGIRDNVTFFGFKDTRGVASLMRRFCVLVVPSVCEESFGIVALEALASGCRVVVTRKGGLPEAANKFGIVVDANSGALKLGMLDALRDSLRECRGSPGLDRYLNSRRGRVVGLRYEKVLCLVARP